MISPRPSPDRAKTPQAASRGGLVSQRTGIVQWQPLANRAGSGALDSVRVGNHLGQKLSYDTSLGLLTGSVLTKDASSSGKKTSSLIGWQRSYDLAGQVLADIRPSGERADYVWDNLSRLTKVSYPGGSSTGKGNLRYSWSHNGVMTSFVHDFGRVDWTVGSGSNQASQSVSTHAGHVAQSWDWHGNRVGQRRYGNVSGTGDQDTSWLEDRRLEYDGEDRLIRASIVRKTPLRDTSLLAYAFSESGLPVASLKGSVSRTNTGDTTWSVLRRRVFEGPESVVDSGVTGWTYRVGNAEFHRDSTGHWNPIYVTTDPVGTTNGLVDDTGKVLAQYQFDAFGNLERYDGTAQTDYLFGGKEWDEELGLYWMGVRLYDPVSGQFISRDALEQYRNPYSYTGGSPLDLVDAWGLEDNSAVFPAVTPGVNSNCENCPAKVPGDGPLITTTVWGKRTQHLDLGGTNLSTSSYQLPEVLGILRPGGLMNLASERQKTAVRIGMYLMGPAGGLSNAAWHMSEGNSRAAVFDVATAGLFGVGNIKAVMGAGRAATIAEEASVGCPGGGCGAGRPSCFVKGTLVSTTRGLKPIEDVVVGDSVASRHESDLSSAWKPVLQLIHNYDKQILRLVLSDSMGYFDTLNATPEHPFHIYHGTWKAAGRLVVGDSINRLNGTWLKVVSSEYLLKHEDTYNFEVADYHSYFVGNLGAWVHNGDCIEFLKRIQHVLKRNHYPGKDASAIGKMMALP